MVSFDELYKLSKKGCINLTGGNPYTKGPSWVREAAIEAMSSSEIGVYPAVGGDTSNKKKVAEFFITPQEQGGMGINPTQNGADKVIFAGGVTQLWHSYIQNLKQSIDKRNAERKEKGLPEKKPVVIMPELTYGLCLEVLHTSGIEVYGIPLRKEKGYRLQASDVKETVEAIEKDGDKEIICLKIDNPHNPTGAILKEEDVRSIAEICCREKIKIFDDLVYFGLESPSKKVFPFAALPRTGIFSNINTLIFTAYSLSKGGGYPSMRVGCGMGTPEDISGMVKSLQDTTGGISYPSQMALTTFLDQENSEKRMLFLEERKKEYLFRAKVMKACIVGLEKSDLSLEEKFHLNSIIQNMDEKKFPGIQEATRNILKKGIPDVEICNPNLEAGFFYLVKFKKDLADSDTQLAKKIMEHKGPFVLPESFFRLPCATGISSEQEGNLARITFSFEKPEVILSSMISLGKSLESIKLQERVLNQTVAKER